MEITYRITHIILSLYCKPGFVFSLIQIVWRPIKNTIEMAVKYNAVKKFTAALNQWPNAYVLTRQV